jgi:anti-sigma B factor antagonist
VDIRASPQRPDITVVSPEGRLDAQAAPGLDLELADLCNRGEARLVLDLSRATYVSSSCLRVFLMCARRLRRAGGDLKLCGCNVKVADVLHITGLDRILDVAADQTQALRTFPGPQEASLALFAEDPSSLGTAVSRCLRCFWSVPLDQRSPEA